MHSIVPTSVKREGGKYPPPNEALLKLLTHLATACTMSSSTSTSLLSSCSLALKKAFLAFPNSCSPLESLNVQGQGSVLVMQYVQ